MESTPFAVAVKDLRTRYGSGSNALDVLKGVSIAVPTGQIFGMIGRSGSGKSTFLRCLNGLEKPISGDIMIEQRSLIKAVKDDQRKILHQIGTVFQSFNLLSRRTVLQNIALPLEFRGVSDDQITVKSREIADLVGLETKHNAFPNQLSGGQRQRVAIARALVSDVSLLLCDEFTSALDPETSLEILTLLRDLNQRLGITIILVTHDISVVREICDQVCVLDQGQIVETGPVEAILLKPQHEVTKSLVSHLFLKDLPRTIHDSLHDTPGANDQAVLRLMFSNETASQPAIASVIQKFNVPINIIAGDLGHVRTSTFGSLMITLPTENAMLDNVLKYFTTHGIAAEILGYTPSP